MIRPVFSHYGQFVDVKLSVGWENSTGGSAYNETWKLHRKNITKVASTNASIEIFDQVQEVESVHFLLNLLDSPDDLFDHIRK